MKKYMMYMFLFLLVVAQLVNAFYDENVYDNYFDRYGNDDLTVINNNQIVYFDEIIREINSTNRTVYIAVLIDVTPGRFHSEIISEVII